jgi:hypothetical protein
VALRTGVGVGQIRNEDEWAGGWGVTLVNDPEAGGIKLSQAPLAVAAAAG